MCAGIWSVTRRGRRSRSTVAQPGLCEREGKKKKEKREKVVLHLLEENIKQPLLGVPPLLLPPTGAPSARIFSCTPTSFFNLFSSFNILVEKGARLVETVHAPIFHARITPGWGQGTKTGTPLPLYLLNLLPLSSMLASIRARLKRKLQRRRGRSTSGSEE